MQDKQKVTLYLPPEMHRQLKIRAAFDAEPMSAIAERAIDFYLEHPETVEQAACLSDSTHQVYACPECTTPVVLRAGKMVSLKHQPVVLSDDGLKVQPATREELVGAGV
ncbi:MAG: hypothetical protein HC934_06540 [Acaryochloridaceae cyanobacterium SU_2_1]|nr:hypothetical protein [Acaryochloridaceae cyanobacterium SU_2_1]NJM95256.1 hypothetical protein [Acaryochloridaceae cyanobacterium CSU_5_19]